MGALLSLLLGCAEQEFEPPDRAERVEQASAAFDLIAFDTLSWASDSVRALEGNVVWASRCRNCHGQMGRGGTPYGAERGLEVPSLVDDDWRWAERRDSVLHRVWAGHARGMPTWGVAGISEREIDAVTHYLLTVLRPDVLRGNGAPSDPPGPAGG